MLWGGTDPEENRHHGSGEQSYAVDFISPETIKPPKNSDYSMFGMDVLAAAAGVVVEVADGVLDNTPGVVNALSAAGNYVKIKHSDNLYSFTAHLLQGSVTVAAGDDVAEGQVIGACGNSGYSSEPHIHFHLMSACLLYTSDAADD